MPHDFPISPALQITALNNCLTCHFPHPYYFPGEFHPFWEMVYATDGTFRAAANEKVYTMKKGDVIFHKPMEFHRLWSLERQDLHAYIIAFTATGSLLEQLESGAFVLTSDQQARLEALMQYAAANFPREERHGMQDHLRMMEEQAKEKQVQIQTYTELLKLFLLSLAEDTAPLTAKSQSNSEDSRLYRAIVELLTQNVNSWITTEEIAAALHYSPTRIKRIFAKYSDIGIHKYLLKLKTAEAIRLLRRGLPCSEVSSTLGFANQNYFSTVFKRETGCTPSLYNQTHPSQQAL